jgi:hypothetical protein
VVVTSVGEQATRGGYRGGEEMNIESPEVNTSNKILESNSNNNSNNNNNGVDSIDISNSGPYTTEPHSRHSSKSSSR